MLGKTIKNIACIGSGLIGQGWATLFSAAGYEVTLQDLNEDSLKRAQEQVFLNLQQLEKESLLHGSSSEDAVQRIKTTLSLDEAVNDVNFILESVPDSYEAKQAVFKEMDALAKPEVILASSSSGLLMSEIQTVTTRPERCIIAHPFLPVHLIPLVEIVGGKQTSQATIETTFQLMKDIGKTPVTLKKEVHGYIVNRLQTAVFREAIDLVANGVASAADVDEAFCSGIGMRDPFIGPLLRAYLTADGIESFFENYSETNRLRLETMATWNTFSPEAKEILTQSINEMPIVRQKGLAEIKSWRDEMLLKLLKLEPRSFGK